MSKRMDHFHLHVEQQLPVSLEEAWNFFASPVNLQKITPPHLHLRVITSLREELIYPGLEIDYTVKPLLGVRVKWKTLISEVKEQHYFTDKQLKGPYSLWEHTHTFTANEQGVLMSDDLKYKLPLGFLGRIMHRLVVRKQIEEIFAYRRQRLEKMFDKNDKPANYGLRV